MPGRWPGAPDAAPLAVDGRIGLDFSRPFFQGFSMAERKTGRTDKIWRDGELVSWEDANIHIISHVAHYGSSVFEGVRCYETPQGGAVFRLREHMERLVNSCKIYRMPLKYSLDELVQATVDTVAANDLRQCYI